VIKFKSPEALFVVAIVTIYDAYMDRPALYQDRSAIGLSHEKAISTRNNLTEFYADPERS
jgi:hypothetical protein